MKKSQILIIDDEITIRTVLERYLSRKYDAVAMDDAEDAINWMQNGNLPSLIIVDIEMPNMNGYEFLKLVKASTSLKEIPVIMLSGTDSKEERDKCINLGAKDFIEKPFNPEELELKIEINIK
ncbi:MAG: response regulator [Bacteroidales bacterium]|jgi:DNA-binding response OmpR family regulator|nr:response regulator [Bacteroidales bacterium]